MHKNDNKLLIKCCTFTVGFPLCGLFFTGWGALFCDFYILLLPVAASGGVSLLKSYYSYRLEKHILRFPGKGNRELTLAVGGVGSSRSRFKFSVSTSCLLFFILSRRSPVGLSVDLLHEKQRSRVSKMKLLTARHLVCFNELELKKGFLQTKTKSFASWLSSMCVATSVAVAAITSFQPISTVTLKDTNTCIHLMFSLSMTTNMIIAGCIFQ